MIPIARGIPSISGPIGATPHGSDTTSFPQDNHAFDRRASAPSALFGRRRSSIDNILENLKFVGAFPTRLLSDFSTPRHPNSLANNNSQPPSENTSTTSLFNSHPSLTRLPSFTDHGAMQHGAQQQQQQQQGTEFAQKIAGGVTPAVVGAEKKRVFPSAEEFLTF